MYPLSIARLFGFTSFSTTISTTYTCTVITTDNALRSVFVVYRYRERERERVRERERAVNKKKTPIV